MENLNAEQVIRAFECCHSVLLGCSDCPFINDSKECADTDRNVLAILNSQEQRIKELTEENERVKEYNNSLVDTIEKQEQEIFSAKADTVRKMSERLKAEFYGKYGSDVHITINKIAKEMLEGENNE